MVQSRIEKIINGPLLPHEIFFGLFMWITWIRLAVTLGLLHPDSLFYLMFILLNLGVILWNRKWNTSRTWQLRLWFYPVAMNLLYFHMKTSMHQIIPEKFDGALLAIDQAMIGKNLSLRLTPYYHPLLTEFMSFCYFLFYIYLTVSLFYFSFGPLGLFQKFFAGLFTIYGIGFLSYTLIPAVGPWLYLAEAFDTPLIGYWITEINDKVVTSGSNGMDVFPSLHCAVSSFILFFDRKHRPWRFRLYLIPCVGLWISTLYLRYHYFIDLLVGFLLSAFALWLINQWEQNRNQESDTTRRNIQ